MWRYVDDSPFDRIIEFDKRFASQQLIVASYSNWAIVTPDSVMVSYPGRLYEIRDRNYQPTGNLKVDQAAAQKALAEMSRFYR